LDTERRTRCTEVDLYHVRYDSNDLETGGTLYKLDQGQHERSKSS
jgi:hypothetical protein